MVAELKTSFASPWLFLHSGLARKQLKFGAFNTDCNILKRGQYIGDLRSNTGAFLQVAFWEERGFNFSVQFQFVQWQFEFSWKFSFLHWSLSDFSAGEAE